jgi:Bacterial SH3 domain
MIETPAAEPSTGDSAASPVTASASESSPLPSPSVDEWELLKEDLRKRAAAPSSAASPTTGSEPVQPTTEPLQTYHVIKVKRGDSLKVRTGPGQTDPVVTTLAPGTRGILLLSGRVANGPTVWQEISFGGHTGWVNEIYLEAEFPRAVPRAVEAR